MASSSWLPSMWRQDDNDPHPFESLRKQFDNLLEDFDRGLPRAGVFNVRSNVSETEKDVRVTVDLPGMEEKDIDVSVVGNRLTIRGEKKSETEEKDAKEGRQFHKVERLSGSFQRTMDMPFDIGDGDVSATFKNGVLTVTIQKPAEVQEKAKKIDVTTG